jgi:hypothetical protein
MAQTKAGWLKAKATMIKNMGGEENYNKWRREISVEGGKAGSNAEWLKTPEGRAHIVAAARKGGKVPRVKS